MFKEVTFSYNIISDPEKRRQYDAAGFEVSILSRHVNCDVTFLFFTPSEVVKVILNFLLMIFCFSFSWLIFRICKLGC